VGFLVGHRTEDGTALSGGKLAQLAIGIELGPQFLLRVQLERRVHRNFRQGAPDAIKGSAIVLLNLALQAVHENVPECSVLAHAMIEHPAVALFGESGRPFLFTPAELNFKVVILVFLLRGQRRAK
jgi:hypothetical protein